VGAAHQPRAGVNARPPLPSEVLEFLAREESFARTLAAFPSIGEAQLRRMLAAVADAARQREAASGAAPQRDSAPDARAATRSGTSAAKPTRATPGRRLVVWFDGASRGNPGPAGAGAVISTPEGEVIARLGRFLGPQTNNVAEYEGLLLGLSHALTLGADELEVRGDSELLVRQLQGRYQVKAPHLKPYFARAAALLKQAARVKLVHVPREQNRDADEMSNRAIDERM